MQNIPLPEMHLSLPKGVTSENVPGGSFNNTGQYSFCGPGTEVAKRISEGYEGVNRLDRYCRDHGSVFKK